MKFKVGDVCMVKREKLNEYGHKGTHLFKDMKLLVLETLYSGTLETISLYKTKCISNGTLPLIKEGRTINIYTKTFDEYYTLCNNIKEELEEEEIL